LELKRLREELSFEVFKDLYRELREKHEMLSPFPTVFDLIEFLHGDSREDRDKPNVQHKVVVADDSKQAELKSGLVADSAWDFDYVTMFSRPICEVNVKEKPLEVANVEK
jgi:hypothetical protein